MKRRVFNRNNPTRRDQTSTIFSLVTMVPSSSPEIEHTFSHEPDELRSEYDNRYSLVAQSLASCNTVLYIINIVCSFHLIYVIWFYESVDARKNCFSINESQIHFYFVPLGINFLELIFSNKVSAITFPLYMNHFSFLWKSSIKKWVNIQREITFVIHK